MTRKGIVGRADLVDILARAERWPSATVLRSLLGYEFQAEDTPDPTSLQDFARNLNDLDPGGPVEAISADRETLVFDVPFWLPINATFHSSEGSDNTPSPQVPVEGPRWRERPESLPEFLYLAEWRELVPRLRDTMDRATADRRVDVDRAVDIVASGQVLTQLPHRSGRRWGPRLLLVRDVSRRLMPLRQDRLMIRHRLKGLIPDHGFDEAWFSDGLPWPMPSGKADIDAPPLVADEGTVVLVLGDLGVFDRSGRATEVWLEFGRELRRRRAQPIALFPGAPERCAPAMRDVWKILPWESVQAKPSEDLDRERVERLFRLVSPATRIQPGLLRAVRRLFPRREMDVSTEIVFWSHGWLVSDHPAAATMEAGRQDRLSRDFRDRESAEMQARFWQAVRPWQAHLPAEFWLDDILACSPGGGTGLPQSDVEDALIDNARFRASVSQGRSSPKAINYLDRYVRRRSLCLALSDRGRAVLADHHRIFATAEGYEAPPGLEPDHVPPPPDAPMQCFEVLHSGNSMTMRPVDETATLPGSPVALIESRNLEIKVAEDEAFQRNTFWASGIPPSWVSDWGHDDHGAWCAFEIGGAVQRLRWVPPGAFMMGSPEDEPGRYDDEGPRHRVEIGEGLWLAETPCTQALWQAVIGDNPSRVVDPERPVEHVSWEDVKGFIGALNHRVPGLELALPSEAQWEFACRAGKEEATWAGAMEILGLNNAPVLDPIAWYGGNSGVDFDLEEGHDSSDWMGKQHPHEKAGTRRVGLKRANPLGLHDMLGNVWEWCADDWHDSYEGAPTDGSAWLDSDDDDGWRWGVVRGASWISGARDVRSARRQGRPPAGRGDAIGFRLARSQKGAVPARDGAVPPAERREAPARPGGAEMIHLTDDAGSAGIPAGPAIRISSDVATLHLRQITKPDWASAIGRDVYGLWTEFELPDTETPVSQRLRWIPPGQFMMGSPIDEPKRRDNEGPQHLVRIASGFWLADTTCTQALWKLIMGENPSRFTGNDLLPVENVSWEMVQTFLEGLNGRLPGLEAVLPNEAQWEFACRAGTDTPFNTGRTITTDQANFDGNHPYEDGEKGEYRKTTLPVHCFRPNRLGLWQMHGNVDEWCADDWHDNYAGAPADGIAWLDVGGDADGRRRRVVRGGSWRGLAKGVRSAFRGGLRSGDGHDFLGFRLARVQQP